MDIKELLRKAMKDALDDIVELEYEEEGEDVEEEEGKKRKVRRATRNLKDLIYRAMDDADEEALVDLFTEQIELGKKPQLVHDILLATLEFLSHTQEQMDAERAAEGLTALVHALQEVGDEQLLEDAINSIEGLPARSLSESFKTKVQAKLPTDVEEILELRSVEEELDSAETLDEMVERIIDLIRDYEPPADITAEGWDVNLVSKIGEIASDVMDKVASGEISIEEFQDALDEIASAIEEEIGGQEEEIAEEEVPERELLKSLILERLTKAVLGDGEIGEREEKTSRIKNLISGLIRRRLQGREFPRIIGEEPAPEEEELPARREVRRYSPERKKRIVVRSVVDGLMGALYAADGERELKRAVKEVIAAFASRFGEDVGTISGVSDLIKAIWDLIARRRNRRGDYNTGL